MKRTPAQIAASKANGAKSKGPKTEEGKARSSKNALTHGLTSTTLVVLEGECPEEWNRFHNHFIAKFQPRDFLESELVLEMACCQWRKKRAMALQTVTVDRSTEYLRDEYEEQYGDLAPIVVQAEVYSNRRQTLESLHQLELRLGRGFDRAYRALKQMRAEYPPAGLPAIPENEPELIAPPVPAVANEPQPTHISSHSEKDPKQPANASDFNLPEGMTNILVDVYAFPEDKTAAILEDR